LIINVIISSLHMGFIFSVVSSQLTVTLYFKMLCSFSWKHRGTRIVYVLFWGICTSHNATGILHTVHTVELILDKCIISHLYMYVMYSLFLCMLLVQFFVNHFGYKGCCSNEYSICTIV